MAAWFDSPIVLSEEATRELPDRLAAAGISGGAVYDALIGLAAAEAGVVLVTADRRALETYRRVGAAVRLV